MCHPLLGKMYDKITEMKYNLDRYAYILAFQPIPKTLSDRLNLNVIRIFTLGISINTSTRNEKARVAWTSLARNCYSRGCQSDFKDTGHPVGNPYAPVTSNSIITGQRH